MWPSCGRARKKLLGPKGLDCFKFCHTISGPLAELGQRNCSILIGLINCPLVLHTLVDSWS